MTIDEKCISEGLSDCAGCDGYEVDCVGYIPYVQFDNYRQTRWNNVMEFYNSLKRRMKDDIFTFTRPKVLDVQRSEKHHNTSRTSTTFKTKK